MHTLNLLHPQSLHIEIEFLKYMLCHIMVLKPRNDSQWSIFCNFTDFVSVGVQVSALSCAKHSNQDDKTRCSGKRLHDFPSDLK